LLKIKRITDANIKLIKNNTSEIKKNKSLLAIYNTKIKAKRGINLNKKHAGLLEGRTKEKIIREKIAHLKQNIQLKEQCDVCLRPIESKKEARQIKQIRQVELGNLRKKHNIIIKKLKISEGTFKKLEKTVKDGQQAELEKDKINIKLSSLENDIKKATTENKQLLKEASEINLKNLKNEISSLKSKLNRNNINKLKSDIKKIEDKLLGIKKTIDKLNIEYGSKVSNREELLAKRKEQKILGEELSKLNDQLIIYDKLRQYFGKDGIQSIIIENVVDELENYTNMTLSKICNEPTSIAIQMQRQSDSGSWTETFDIEVNINNRKDDFEALSGGEKFRISLALRLAFSKILSKRMGGVVKFLLLDEVSSSLDPKGLNMFAEIVKQLSNEMKILVITHDDRLKDKFEDIIIVERDSGGSRTNI
jgi:exonuclease SbcC